jgi:hypothetical protein
VGKIVRQRIILAAAVVAPLAFAQAAPASASSTLLSGYGGPGQGNQAILGSTLIGGGGGGNGAGGGAGAGSSSASSSSSSSPSSIALPQTAARPAQRAAAHRHHAKPSASGNASKTITPAYVPATPASDRAAGGKTLGLTGDDLLYIVLAFGALALTALLTVRLARRASRADGTQ